MNQPSVPKWPAAAAGSGWRRREEHASQNIPPAGSHALCIIEGPIDNAQTALERTLVEARHTGVADAPPQGLCIAPLRLGERLVTV